jgi:hypothetical protein
MKLPSLPYLPSRTDVHFVVGAVLAVGVLIAFVFCTHGF